MEAHIFTRRSSSLSFVAPSISVIEAISNPFDVMQGTTTSIGGHVPACKCHSSKLSNAITKEPKRRTKRKGEKRLLPSH